LGWSGRDTAAAEGALLAWLEAVGDEASDVNGVEPGVESIVGLVGEDDVGEGEDGGGEPANDSHH